MAKRPLARMAARSDHARGRVVSLFFAASIISAASVSAQTPLFILAGQNEFGNDVEHLGDVNSDGCDDFAIGIPRDSAAGTFAGRVEVRSGGTSQILYVSLGAAPGDQFGNRVVAIGDVDSDGAADFAAGSLESGANALSGYVRLISGGTGKILRTFYPHANDNGFARAIAGGEDADGDGIPDLLIGAFASNRAYLYSCHSGEEIAQFAPQTLANDAFGMSVEFVPDADQDDAPDCVIGAPFGNYVAIQSSAGGQLVKKINGESAGARFGTWVARVGDTNDDGIEDIAVGAPLANSNGPSAGYAAVVSSRSGVQLLRVDGLAGYEFGSRVEGAGDIDQDGRPDFAVGSPNADLALLYSGASGATIAAFPGDGTSYGYGGVLAGGGDCDHDGVPNLIVGSTGHPLSMPLLLQVKVFKECAGAFQWVGNGCKIPTGIAPRLDVSGCAKAGSFLAIRVSGSNKPTPALVVFGTHAANVALPSGGCPLLVGGISTPLTMTLTLTPQTLGSGEKTIFLPLPFGVPAGDIWMQALLPESSTAIATTNAVRLTAPGP
jgi:FG-GAP repeat